jgi:hypothetical protein
VLNRNDRYILGAVIFLALAGALFLYSTRKGDEPTNQVVARARSARFIWVS